MIVQQYVYHAGKKFEFFKIELFTAPLLLLKGGKGFIMCGYLNIEAADRLGEAAARVTGVKDLESFLQAKLVEVTKNAESLGLYKGMRVEKALPFLF